MSTPTPGDEPTQEEIEAYLAQLREAPVAELLLQAFSVLGTGAEVKLGLPDARLLIDSMEALIGASGGALGETADRLSEAVAQLKMAQVQAEKQLAAEQGQGQQGQGKQGQGQQQGQGQEGGDQPAQERASGPGGEPQQRATDKLWIPGRDG